jgi:hypothetical protein
MTDTTSNLELPYIQPSQAQKHITHNEALQRLDAITQLVISDSCTEAPAAPEEGACFAVLAPATGDFAGQDGKIAFRQNGGWLFLEPRAGWRAWFLAASKARFHDGAEWQDLSALDGTTMPKLGINAAADLTDRLSLNAASSLFNHDGAGHRLKINKLASGETASVVFQDNFSGRAEMGLNGNDNLSLKVSADGASWATALDILPGGVVKLPQRPAARTSYTEIDLTRPNGSLTGFATLHVNQGGFALGDAVPNGLGYRLVVPVSGLYHVCLSMLTGTMPSAQLFLCVNGVVSTLAVRDLDVGNFYSIGLTTNSLMYFNAGDALWTIHGGTGEYKFGQGKTELMMVMV